MMRYLDPGPQATLDNYGEVLEFCGREPSRIVTTLGHFVVSQQYKPIVTFEEGAEDRIGNLLAEGQQADMLANHVYGADVRHLPALLWREPVFKPMIGKTYIFGKSELTQGDELSDKLQRWIYYRLGMIPLIRGKDVNEVIWSDSTKAAFDSAKEAAIDLGATKFDQGFHETIFPEGERDESLDKGQRNPNVVRPFKHGFAEMILRSHDPANIFIITPGLSYPELPHQDPETKKEKRANKSAKLHPDIYIPHPIEVAEGHTVEDLVELAHCSLETAVKKARRVRALREYAEGCNDGTVQNEIYGAMDNDPDFEV